MSFILTIAGQFSMLLQYVRVLILISLISLHRLQQWQAKDILLCVHYDY